MWKVFVSPRWIGWHVLLLVSLAVLGWIGWWQFDKARGQGDWQNYGYAVQWWLFAGFAVFLWVKLVLDELDPQRVQDRAEQPPLPQPDRRPTAGPTGPAPTSAATSAATSATAPDEDDDELAAYNRHLARLAEQARE